MPDTDEHTDDFKTVNNINNNYSIDSHTSSNISSTTIIRYSKDAILSLHNSPLVCKPENMPPLSSWFCEEAGSPAVSKSMLNGSVVSRSTDKNIVLGPSNTNFASSLYGGLKHTTEFNGGATMSTSKSTYRLRQSEDSIQIPNGNNRLPRGPAYGNEKNFYHHHHHNNNNNSHHHHHSRHEKSGLERRTSNSIGNQSVSQNERFNQSDHQGERQPTNSSTNGGRKDFVNCEQQTRNRNSHSNHNDRNRNGQDRVPEWMDYDPTDTKNTFDTDDILESRGDFANDLEAWKSSMKEKEGLDNVLKNSIEESLPSPQINGNNNEGSIYNSLDSASLELTSSSTTPDNVTSSAMGSSFNSSIAPLDLPTKQGSRFAKFFAKREEESQLSSTTTSPLTHEGHAKHHIQPKSIIVKDLFQAHCDGLPVETVADQVPPRNDQHASPSVRMLSEEDILQAMGTQKSVTSIEQANQNAIGFNKVLQILSQPKPIVPVSPPTNTNITSSPKTDNVQNIEKQHLDHHNKTTTDDKATNEVYSPNVNQPPTLNTEASSPHVSHTQPSTPTTKPKKVCQLFGGNLPTSVLRQMSARSERRSPSLSSNKSGHSGRFSLSTPNSQNGSPVNGHVSPSMHFSSATQQQNSPSEVYHAIPMRVTEAQATTTQQYQPDFGLESNRLMMNTTYMTRNGYNIFQSSDSGIIPPLSTPHYQQQQQQALNDRSYMPPHYHHPHPPMPLQPMIGLPGQHHMMSPHLSMQLQGAPVNGLLPPHPFMQQHLPPSLMPGMPPPQPMAMGMPQHMYTSKMQGWNNQQ